MTSKPSSTSDLTFVVDASRCMSSKEICLLSFFGCLALEVIECEEVID
jgi:hypothetical protein